LQSKAKSHGEEVQNEILGGQLLASQESGSGKESGVFVEENLILLDPSKTKMLPCSAMRRTSLADGESISKLF